ncbi:MAG: hypothetical protein N2593_03960 [Patescibacteria group bacterium]|nr:hypothetical protein [Patescibacteria group bacterium]
MEEPNVEEILEDLAKEKELKIDVKHEKWLIHAINKRLLYKKPITLFTRLKFFIYNLLDSFSLKADRYFGLGHEEELTVEVIPVIFFDKNNK